MIAREIETMVREFRAAEEKAYRAQSAADSDVLKALVFLLRLGAGTHVRQAEVTGVH